MDQPVTSQQVEQMIDRMGMNWADAFNQNLLLTVQAVLHLHIALDAKFTRKDASEI